MVTLTAIVKAGSTALKTGQVQFCDATAKYCTDIHVLGTAQLTPAGTATLKFRPGLGSHSYKAVFHGTSAYATSSSAASALMVTGTATTLASTTTIAETGAWSKYTLSATVTESGGTPAASGSVSFLDTSNKNAVLDTATLGPAFAGLDWPTPQNLTTTTGTQAVAVDQKTDLVVLSYDGDSTSYITPLLGNGAGSFTVKPTAVVFAQGFVGGDVIAGNLVATDFNGDGKLDLAVVGDYVSAGGVTILLGNGDSTFKAAGTNLEPTQGYGYIATGDFNGDGIPDLVALQYFEPGATVFLGKGDGTFTETTAPPAAGRVAMAAGTPETTGSQTPLPVMEEIFPVAAVTLRMALLLVSAMYRLPWRSTAIEEGLLSSAAVARPPSPL